MDFAVFHIFHETMLHLSDWSPCSRRPSSHTFFLSFFVSYIGRYVFGPYNIRPVFSSAEFVLSKERHIFRPKTPYDSATMTAFKYNHLLPF